MFPTVSSRNMRKPFAGRFPPAYQSVVPRPKLPPQLIALKESFSAPAYIVRAAREAAKEPGKFSAWVTESLRQKLERENPGLLEKYRSNLALYEQRETPLKLVAEQPQELSRMATASQAAVTPKPHPEIHAHGKRASRSKKRA